MLYIPKFFHPRELVPPHEYDLHKDKVLHMLDVTALVTLDALRERYGPIVVNNWSTGGNLQYCGWRPMTCPEGAELSQHKFGRAFDCHFKDVAVQDVWGDLIARPNLPAFRHIHRVEVYSKMLTTKDRSGWFHFDMGNHARYGAAIRVIHIGEVVPEQFVRDGDVIKYIEKTKG